MLLTNSSTPGIHTPDMSIERMLVKIRTKCNKMVAFVVIVETFHSRSWTKVTSPEVVKL